jgi:hypothetical protein
MSLIFSVIVILKKFSFLFYRVRHKSTWYQLVVNEQVLSKSEIYHIELCIETIKEVALALSKEVTLLPSMKALFD